MYQLHFIQSQDVRRLVGDVDETVSGGLEKNRASTRNTIKTRGRGGSKTTPISLSIIKLPNRTSPLHKYVFVFGDCLLFSYLEACPYLEAPYIEVTPYLFRYLI